MTGLRWGGPGDAKRRLLLTAYLLVNTEAPPPLFLAGKWVRLTRYYLGLLAQGVPPTESDDLSIADAYLAQWEGAP